MEIKSIKPKSLARITGVGYAIMGFIFGIGFAGLAMFAPGPNGAEGATLLFGLGAPIVLAVAYGAMGFIFSYPCAWVYNFLAKRVGGIEIET